MNIHRNLSEINKRLADRLAPAFAENIVAYESGEDGSLLFRGPIVNHDDPAHVGTHVSVTLDPEVLKALDSATEEEREEMMPMLVSSLAGQVEARYHPERVGQFAMKIIGTMATLGL